MEVAPGVETVGDVEVISFLENDVAGGTGLLIDSRVPDGFAKGTIPGAVNCALCHVGPDQSLSRRDPEALGATQSGGAWDFSGAMALTLFCNGTLV